MDLLTGAAKMLGGVAGSVLQGITEEMPGPSRPRTIPSPPAIQRKRKNMEEYNISLAAKRAKTTTPAVALLESFKEQPVQVAFGKQDINIAERVMRSGGASVKGCEIMAALKKVMSDGYVDVGFSYRSLEPRHQEHAASMMSWATGVKGAVARAAVNVVSWIDPDLDLLKRSFKEKVIDNLRVSKGNLPPSSIEAIAVNGLSSLSGDDIRYFAQTAKSIDLSQAYAGESHPLLGKLVNLLKKMDQHGQIEEPDLDFDFVSLDSFVGKEGIFAVTGEAKLPEFSFRFNLVYICSADDAAVIVMIHAGDPKNPVKIPALIRTDAVSANACIRILQQKGVVNMQDVLVCKVSPSA